MVKRLRNIAVGRSCAVFDRSSSSVEPFCACLEQYWVGLCELEEELEDDRERFRDNKEFETSFGDVRWLDSKSHCSQPQLKGTRMGVL